MTEYEGLAQRLEDDIGKPMDHPDGLRRTAIEALREADRRVPYDSRGDTREHIAEVQARMHTAIGNLLVRSQQHDRSKLFDPERSGWDEATPKLAGLEYGTEEYRTALREIKPLIETHYQFNDHHPEHYEREGCRGMSLMALIEMLCDWSAASIRHNNPKPIEESIAYNQQRFGFTPELADILKNTARELGLV